MTSPSSICVVFCVVVHELKQAGGLKSGISLLASVHQRCVLYQELMNELVLVFEFTLTTEPMCTTNMQVDLNMKVLHRELSSKLTRG
jgi:hypothetical protein